MQHALLKQETCMCVYKMLELTVTVEWVVLLLHIQRVRDSSLNTKISYAETFIRHFL